MNSHARVQSSEVMAKVDVGKTDGATDDHAWYGWVRRPIDACRREVPDSREVEPMPRRSSMCARRAQKPSCVW